MGVSLGDLDYFATAAQNPMNEGLGDDSFIFSRGDISSKIYVTEPVSGYIHFLIRIEERGGGMTHRCRTKELVVVDIGENVEFVFTDGSQVVDSEDAARVLSLTDMDAYLRTQLTW
jgi:hypothetical protein